MPLRSPLALAVAFAGAVLVAAPPDSAAATPPPTVRLLGAQVIPFGLQFQGTTVGGLSGLDRDPNTGTWYFISDDRSDLQPARFYTANVDLDADGLNGVELTGTAPFTQPDGSTFPEGSVDPEDIRVDPLTGELFWTSEGDRLPDAGVLIDPTTYVSNGDGQVLRTIDVPENLRMSADDVGPRRNETLEGLTLPKNGSLSVTAMEGPLIQDGPSPTPANGALTRITVQTADGQTLAQYAYPADPVFAQPNPAGSASNNGVSAILDDGPGRYLVMERAFVTGVGNSIRIYRVHTAGATDVLGVDSLAGADIQPLDKELLVDLGDVGLSTVDNVEGMAWGPYLGPGNNGHAERALVLVSDNNFSASQVTQVIALAVRE